MNRNGTSRGPRIGAIAIAAVLLASCRSLTVPALVPAVMQTAARIEATDNVEHVETTDHAAAERPNGSLPGGSLRDGPDDRATVGVAPAEERRIRDPAVRPAGCEPPCPPLPRRHLRMPRGGCPTGACTGAGHCNTGHCQTGRCATGSCGTGGCESTVCLPLASPVPVVGPYLVCDGGDCFAPAKPVGASGIANLTAGDTVARYRAESRLTFPRAGDRLAARYPVAGDQARDQADDRQREEAAVETSLPDDDEEVCIAVANCACVFSPRFASVREIIRPFEEAAPVGPRGLSREAVVEADVGRQPVWGSTQPVAPESARKALPGVAVEERLPPLALDQNEIPAEADGAELPNEKVAEEQPMLTLRAQRPLLRVGFDVPLAWTCVKAANVLVNDETATVIAADRGTATLRFEEPGRAELTLCKRAGSDTARIGEELDFTIYLLNSGDRPLTDVVLVDALPKRLELIPDAAASSLPADFSTGTGDDGSVVLTWRFRETLRPGESGFVRFRTIVR